MNNKLSNKELSLLIDLEKLLAQYGVTIDYIDNSSEQCHSLYFVVVGSECDLSVEDIEAWLTRRRVDR